MVRVFDVALEVVHVGEHAGEACTNQRRLAGTGSAQLTDLVSARLGVEHGGTAHGRRAERNRREELVDLRDEIRDRRLASLDRLELQRVSSAAQPLDSACLDKDHVLNSHLDGGGRKQPSEFVGLAFRGAHDGVRQKAIDIMGYNAYGYTPRC